MNVDCPDCSELDCLEAEQPVLIRFPGIAEKEIADLRHPSPAHIERIADARRIDQVFSDYETLRTAILPVTR